MRIKRTIRRREVLSKTGLSATTIHNLEKAGEFPQHFLLTPRCAVYDESEIDAWLDRRRKTPAVAAANGPKVALRRRAPGRGRRRQ